MRVSGMRPSLNARCNASGALESAATSEMKDFGFPKRFAIVARASPAASRAAMKRARSKGWISSRCRFSTAWP